MRIESSATREFDNFLHRIRTFLFLLFFPELKAQIETIWKLEIGFAKIR